MAGDTAPRRARPRQTEPLGVRVHRALTRVDLRLLTVLGLVAVLTLSVAFRIRPFRHHFEVGAIAPTTIYASRDLRWEAEEETERLRQLAMEAVPKRYTRLPGALASMQQRADAIIDIADDIAERGGPREPTQEATDTESAPAATEAEIRARLATLGYAPTPLAEVVAAIAAMSAEDRVLLRQACIAALERIDAEEELRDDEPERNAAKLARVTEELARLRAYGLPQDETAGRALIEICRAAAVPNMQYSAELTEKERAAAADQVRPRLRSLQRGERVVTRGTTVTQDAIDALEQLGLLNPPLQWPTVAVSLAVLALTLATSASLLVLFAKPTLAEPARLLLASGLLAIPVVVTNLAADSEAVPFFCFGLGEAATLVSTTLLCPVASAVLAGQYVATCALILGTSHTVALFSALMGCAAGMIASRAQEYRAYKTATLGVYSAVFALLAVFTSRSLLERGPAALLDDGWAGLVHAGQHALLSGLFGVVAGHLGNRYLEYPIGTVTMMRLVELSDPRQPLLHELLTKAPGTYSGSQWVADLAERAAAAIGADSHTRLLVRVGGQYHDIGKASRPFMFFENQQRDGHNPHDGLDPLYSARTVIQHVHDGIELAEQRRLPVPIRDCIREHHGTTLVRYFYAKALEADPNTPEQGFRYPGPKPQSVATGILMLADSVEAAVRALRTPSREEIKEQVNAVIEERIEDGQLDECPLTVKQVAKIRDALTEALQGIYHHRIEYPPLPG